MGTGGPHRYGFHPNGLCFGPCLHDSGGSVSDRLCVQTAHGSRAVSFMAIMVCSMLYSLVYIRKLGAGSAVSARFWFDFSHIPIPLQHYLWLALSVQLCSVPNKPRRVLLGAALVHPLAYL